MTDDTDEDDLLMLWPIHIVNKINKENNNKLITYVHVG